MIGCELLVGVGVADDAVVVVGGGDVVGAVVEFELDTDDSVVVLVVVVVVAGIVVVVAIWLLDTLIVWGGSVVDGETFCLIRLPCVTLALALVSAVSLVLLVSTEGAASKSSRDCTE